jgi:ABC-type transport system involved in cytochrome c biogenesis ATPase subunit
VIENNNLAVQELEIQGFRGLDGLKLKQLAPINIIIGGNGVGKTTLLEAIHLACSGAQIFELVNLAQQRSLYTVGSNLVFINFFTKFDENARPTISLTTPSGQQQVQLSLENVTAAQPLPQDPNSVQLSLVSVLQQETRLGLKFTHPSLASGSPTIHNLSLRKSQNGGISQEGNGCGYCIASKYIGTQLTQTYDVAATYSILDREGKSQGFMDTMSILDPRIQALRVSAETSPPTLLCSLNDGNNLPLSLLGEGATRIARIASAFETQNVKVVCIDEIDTGLNRSVLKSLWTNFGKHCSDRGIQLFCTTHDFEMINGAVEAFVDQPDTFAVHLLKRRSDGTVGAISRKGASVKTLIESDFDVMH